MDLFELDYKIFLVVVDYYSRFTNLLRTLLWGSDKRAKQTFCMLGIPNTIVSDNGPQYVSDKFRLQFVERWDITHIKSSPRYSQSNGEAERAVQRVKGPMGIHRDTRVDVKRLKMTEENSQKYQEQYYNSKHLVQR